MTNYDRRVLERLVSLSHAKTSPAVFREWEQIPNRQGWCSDVCHLCGHNRNKYRHLIRNKITGQMLLIGSNCIDHWVPGGPGWVQSDVPVLPRAA